MNTTKIFRSLFAFALAVVMAGGMLHLSTAPADAFIAINCSLYERPGCYFVDVLDEGNGTYCCYFEGEGCIGGYGFRVGPCWQDPF